MTTIAHSMSAARPDDEAACGAGFAPSPAEAGEGWGGVLFSLDAAGATPSRPPPASAGGGEEIAALSITAITAPSETASPSLTFSALITPSAIAGTSMVALSDSSVTRPWSFFTVSPTATRISMTGTSPWLPMSGTLLSMSAMTGSLQHGPTHVGQQLCEIGGETRGCGAVDHAMVVAQRQRHDQARLEGLAVPDRLRLRLRHTEDRDFGRIDDRGEPGAADPAQRTDGEAAALHLLRLELAVARQRGEIAHLAGDLHHALPVGVAQHRHHQAVRRVGREADVVVLLEDEVVAVQRCIEVREFLQRDHAGLDHEGKHGDLAGLARGDRLGVLVVQGDAHLFELGDVGIVVLGDVRDHRPV